MRSANFALAFSLALVFNAAAAAHDASGACTGFSNLGLGSWSWANGQLAFTGDCGGVYGLYLYDVDADRIERLDTGAISAFDPTWSNKGDRIVFSSQLNHKLRDIFIVDVATGAVAQITDEGAHGGRMSWSPDDQWLAFYRPTDEGQWNIYKMRTDGGEVTRLNPETYADYFNPTWSPDGSSYLYASNKRIWRVTDDPMNPVALTPENIHAVMPQWAPDGMSFIYDGHAGDNWELYQYTLESGANRRVTSDLIMTWNAAWGPDGERVAYLCQPENYTTFCLKNIRTGEMRVLFRP